MRKKPKSLQQEVIAAYRSRFRRWTMEALPDMPDDQWARLLLWVGAFGHTGNPDKAARRFVRDVQEHLAMRDVTGLGFAALGPSKVAQRERRKLQQVTAPVTKAARRRKGRTPLIAFKAEKEHK
jgi:hypothetical protein